MIEGIYAWKRKALIILTALAATLFPVYCLKAQPVEQVLYYYVPLYESRADANADLVNALLKSPGLADFTHVMLIVPSLYELPNATEHVLVKHATNILQERGVPFYWCRLLWPAWSVHPDMPVPDANSHYRPEYYATAIATVRAEARKLGAIGCGFDAELYGNDPIHKALRVGLTETQQARMLRAIQDGTEIAGKVDIIEPCMYPGDHVYSYVWPLCDLGEIQVTTTTYYDTTVAEYQESPRFPTVPACYTHEFEYWGIHLGDGVTGNGTPLVTREQLDAMDWDAIRVEYPSIRGSFIYIGLDKRAEVVGKWNPG